MWVFEYSWSSFFAQLTRTWIPVLQLSCPLVIPFSSCLLSFSASGSFSMSQLFSSGGQSSGASASASVLPMNMQCWSPLGWKVWISLQSRGLSRVFSSTQIQSIMPIIFIVQSTTQWCCSWNVLQGKMWMSKDTHYNVSVALPRLPFHAVLPLIVHSSLSFTRTKSSGGQDHAYLVYYCLLNTDHSAS